jgi:hypothetical protein
MLTILRNSKELLGSLLVGFAVLTAAPSLFAQVFYNATGTLSTNLVGQGDVEIGNATGSNFTFNIVTGAATGYQNTHLSTPGLNLYNAVTVNVTGGNLWNANTHNTSTLNIRSGANFNTLDGAAGTIRTYDSSQVNMSGGIIGSTIHFENSSSGLIAGGFQYGGIYTQDLADVTVTGGDSTGITSGNGYSSTFADGGSTLSATGGTLFQVVLNTNDSGLYGSQSPLPPYYGKATFNFGGHGVILAGIQSQGMGSVVNITGGTINADGTGGTNYDIANTGGGTVNISGGKFSTGSSGPLYNLSSGVYINGNLTFPGGTYNIYGSNLVLTPSGGITTYDGSWTGQYYTLTGTLANGDPINTFYFGCTKEFSYPVTSTINLINTGSSATTVPVGYTILTASAGTGTAPTSTAISLPLLGTPAGPGQLVGRITSLTSNTLTNANAAWTSGQLSTLTAPSLIRITSGAAVGRTFLLSTAIANTATTATLDGSETVDLTTLGIQTGSAGDTYTIIPADTLSSTFGTPATSGILGGTSATTADSVSLLENGVWSQYFYKTSVSRWVKNTLGNPDATNKVIRPDAAVLFNRLTASPLAMTVLGTVPALQRNATVANAGLTFLAQGFPLNYTFANSNIQNLPGWTSGTTASSADTVSLLQSGVWKQYFFDGTNWRLNTLGTPVRNADVISAGSAFLIGKQGSAASTSILTQDTPYTLE